MYVDEILDNANVNGGVKKIIKETDAIEFDATTGKLTRNLKTRTQVIGREPDYIKIYTGCMLLFNNIDVALSPFIVAFGRHMTYANNDNVSFRCTVRTDELVRHDVAKYCKVSDARVKQVIRELVKEEIFIPIQIDGKKKRGIYFVNPWVVGKGEWKDIKQLRGQFEFVSGTVAVAIEEGNKRRVIMPITSKTKKVLSDSKHMEMEED